MRYLVCAILFHLAALSCGAQTSLGLRKHLASRKPNKKDLVLSVCGDDTWVAFEDTKCFKLINELVTREEAYEECSMESPSHDSLNTPLPVIKSKEEQEFLMNYIFNRSLALDSVWLGGRRRSDNNFEWDDGSQTVYSNWADDNPSKSADKRCMMLAHKNSIKQNVPSLGLWREAPCGNKILVVCQKLQKWNRNEMQKAIINLRDEMKKSSNVILTLRETAQRTDSLISNLNNEVKRADKSLQALKSNPVPIGFIYVQLYGQPTPSSLWPRLGWSEVSSSYAGQFFRVLGGNAASFGTVQNDNAPRITHASSGTYTAEHTISLPVGGSSSHLYTGSSNFMGKSKGMAFSTSSGEVRPINQAVKLWKRTS